MLSLLAEIIAPNPNNLWNGYKKTLVSKAGNYAVSFANGIIVYVENTDFF